MQLHELKSKNRKQKKRIGRGGSRGTYSGKGIKGQKSRAGTGGEPIIRGFIKRYPKLRGFKNQGKEKPVIVNLDSLELHFKKDEIVSAESLLEKEIIRKREGKFPEIKILSRGELFKPLTIKGCIISKVAEEKVKKAGGKIS